jgi:hypothetical protein
MSDHQSRTASDDVYDHELEEPRSGRRRRPVADWGVGEDMFEHMPRNRFSRVAEGPPRDRRFSSRAADADRRSAGEPTARESLADEAPARHGDVGRLADARHRDVGRLADARPVDEAPAREESAEGPATRDLPAFVDEWTARDDSGRARREEPRRWTGPLRDDADEEDEAPGQAAEDVPRGRAADGRRTIVIGKPEDVPSEIAAITADRDLGDDDLEDAPAAAAPERRTVRIGGRPEGSLEAARSYRERSRRRPPRRAHERLGARPDRIAMWAFALGLLLILIAILTAH